MDLSRQLRACSTGRLVVESQDLRVHVTLVLLSSLDFLLGHLEFVLCDLQMVGGLQQVWKVSVSCEAGEVDVGKSIDVGDQLTHQVGVGLGLP